MKLNSLQMNELHELIWEQEPVRMVVRNKYGTQSIVTARLSSLTPEGIVVNFDTLQESSYSSHVPVEALFYTELKKEKGWFKKASLRDGFFVEKIVTRLGFEIFENDAWTMAKAKKLFAENSENDKRNVCDIAVDTKYSHLNQFIGERVMVLKHHDESTIIRLSGVLEYATRTQNSGIYLTLSGINSREDVRVDSNSDLYVCHNGFTSQIFELADSEEVKKSNELYQEQIKTKQAKVQTEESEPGSEE